MGSFGGGGNSNQGSVNRTKSAQNKRNQKYDGSDGGSDDNNQQHQTHPTCLLYTSPSPRDRQKSRMPSSA